MLFYFFKAENVIAKEVKMKKRILTATIFALLSLALLLNPTFARKALAADKLGWVGPVYTELAESLTKGFKDYYKKTYGKGGTADDRYGGSVSHGQTVYPNRL